MLEQTIKVLEDIGFTPKEALIYLALLEIGEALPSTIARKTGVKRPTTYVILEQLKEKGFVSHLNKKGSLFYSATDPKLILEEEKNKCANLEATLPELQMLNEKFGVTPQMSLYEGKSGLMQIMEDTLTTKGELCCWSNPNIAMTLLEDYYPSYIKKKIQRKIWLRGVFCYDKFGLKFKTKGKKELREVYLIPEDKFPFKNEINIYDDKVAIISHEDQVGVIIQNKNIADTQKAIFNLGFEYAKILEKQILTKDDIKYLEEE